MKKNIRLFLLFSLVLSVFLATGSGAWASSLSWGPNQTSYLQKHPNLERYLTNNPQVAQQIEGLSAGQGVARMLKSLAREIEGFGGGYVGQHHYLALYLNNNPRVERRITNYQNQPGPVQGNNGPVMNYQGQPGPGPVQGNNGAAGGHGPLQFSDVPGWAQQAVTAMAARGIIKGMGHGIFGSNQTLTRAQFAALLVREFELSTSGSVYGTMTFADVPATFWAYNDIEAAAPDMTYWTENGQNYFHPGDPADREDAIVAMVEATGLAKQTPNPSDLAKFVDAGNISPNLVNLVSIAVQTGLITGSQGADGNWYLRPQANLTRAQGAVLLYRALGYSKVAPGMIG